MCVKVFLADDAEIMRKAIRTLLSTREDIAVIGEASDFRETIQKTAELHPDLIIFERSPCGPKSHHANRSQEFGKWREGPSD